MKFEIISTSYRGAAKKLFPRLRGRVFHITSPENFILICKSGEIRNNKDGSLQKNWNSGFFRPKAMYPYAIWSITQSLELPEISA